jgi:hypothetical protein
MKHRFPPDCPKRLADLIGRKVRITEARGNGFFSFAAGTIMTVRYSNRWDSLRLEGGRCECCGIAPFIDVSVAHVTIVKDSDLLTDAAAA